MSVFVVTLYITLQTSILPTFLTIYYSFFFLYNQNMYIQHT